MLDFFNNDWRHHLRLDIVGFLAILGDASVQVNAQATFLSPVSFLPRLVPAPQALIQPRRPTRLAPEEATVVGRKSGNLRSSLNPFTHILHKGEELQPFEVRWVSVKSKGEDKGQDAPVEVKVNLWGPLTWLALFACALFVALLVLSVVFGDGWSLIATLLLGFLTTLIQYGSWNKLDLPHFNPPRKRRLPKADVVVKYPEGGFIVVRCREKIARKLYFGVERCKYAVPDGPYRAVALASILFLMFAVIFLANAKKKMQLAIAASYIILNAAYWLVAAIPLRYHWNTDAFDVKLLAREQGQNYTDALWTTIAITGNTDWVSISGVAPQNDPWKNWLEEARLHVEGWKPGYENNKPLKPQWQHQDALTRLLREAEDAQPDDSDEDEGPLAPDNQHGGNAAARLSQDMQEKEDQNAASAALNTVADESTTFGTSFGRPGPAGSMG